MTYQPEQRYQYLWNTAFEKLWSEIIAQQSQYAGIPKKEMEERGLIQTAFRDPKTGEPKQGWITVEQSRENFCLRMGTIPSRLLEF